MKERWLLGCNMSEKRKAKSRNLIKMTVASVSKKFLHSFKVPYQGAVGSANNRTPRGSCPLWKSTPISNKKHRPYAITSTKDFSAWADVGYVCLCYSCLRAESLENCITFSRLRAQPKWKLAIKHSTNVK